MSPLQRTTRIWIHGLIATMISGGAGGVTSGIGASMIAPESFNLHGKTLQTIGLMLLTFVLQGALGAFLYLKQSPLPPEAETQASAQAAGVGK